jgi:sulfite exporter TauE/SafE
MVLTALLLGFAGSLHCMGMCSPLVMAVSNFTPSVFLNRLLYNGGRILTYATIGAAVASLGYLIPILKFQNALSVVMGIVLLAVGLFGLSRIQIPIVTKAGGAVSIRLKSLFAAFFNRKSFASIFVLGMLNGILPCGLSFLALATCVTLKGPLDGFNFMLLFGVGTLPVMLGFTSGAQWIARTLHFSVQKLTMGMMILSGLLLILRVFLVQPHAADDLAHHVIDVVCR